MVTPQVSIVNVTRASENDRRPLAGDRGSATRQGRGPWNPTHHALNNPSRWVMRNDGCCVARRRRVVIFVNDHPPAHVHVFGDGEAKINLVGADDAPALVWADGMSRGEARRAMRLVVERRAFLLARWEEFHGRADRRRDRRRPGTGQGRPRA
jgi:hypothetical protein